MPSRNRRIMEFSYLCTPYLQTSLMSSAMKWSFLGNLPWAFPAHASILKAGPNFPLSNCLQYILGVAMSLSVGLPGQEDQELLLTTPI
jgi:hypothetical protein